jgi:DinB superfamily
MSGPPDRAAEILDRFNAAQRALVARLRDMPADAAEHASSGGGWSAAQVGWHVALTNAWAAAVLLGDKIGKPSCTPPDGPSRDAALIKLRASGQQVAKAIATLSADRAVSLFDIAESVERHVAHHLAQIDRAIVPV